MKKSLITLVTVVITCTFSIAQLAIGKISIESNESILEFSDNEGMGIILPWVETLPNVESSLSAGTILYDMSSLEEMRIKYYNGYTWKNLTNKSTLTNTERTALLSDRGSSSQEIDQYRVVLGDTAAVSSNGVLILADDTRAMTLPRVSSYMDIKSPSPGTVVFDTTTKMICFYNGSKWSFWGHKI